MSRASAARVSAEIMKYQTLKLWYSGLLGIWMAVWRFSHKCPLLMDGGVLYAVQPSM